MNKFLYIIVIQGKYGLHGWEDLSEYDNIKEGRKLARQDIREYRLAEPYANHRIIKRRVSNGQYRRIK